MSVKITGRLEVRAEGEDANEAMLTLLWLVGHLRQQGYDVDDVVVTVVEGENGDERETITCPRCGMTSAHSKDIEQGYCGNCHDWTTDRERLA